MVPSQLTLLDLPAALLGRVLNGRALSNADRVNAMCACRALRDGDVVEFRDIVLRSCAEGGRAAIVAALTAARGRCETLNRGGGYVDAVELAAVGEARPELVARLRAVRVYTLDAPRPPPPFPRALFPALDTINVAHRVTDPNAGDLSDPRVVLSFVTLTGSGLPKHTGACEHLARSHRPPESLTVELQIGNPAQLPDIERAREVGLRVGHVNLLNITLQPGVAWDRLCAVGAALAVHSLLFVGPPFSLDVMQHIDANTVRLLYLDARPGSFVALEARFKRGAGLALTVNVQLRDNFPEDDVAALERLLSAGTIASLRFKAGSGMDASVWRRVFAAASTALHTVDMGRIRSVDDALAIFSSAAPAPAAVADLTFDIHPVWSTVASYRALGTQLARMRCLRNLTFVTCIGTAAFRALVKELMAGNPGVEHVRGSKTFDDAGPIWSRKDGFALV